ncbi:ligand-effect modulator 3 LEM3 family protein, putative [Ichthyophthirius multifiliis]|uniref:Ligand-effect modulator 3 LEM3 family protein, putative n=1 Tax=Ichthyophthirius multifiliis TaxID=5932 RepID=G0QLL7_ICHMU|nr:ligand-effect modulator 3 LEM3 family protein, putative [Ichthyophthirius multifiliis]EGR33890.1 ligand-effect modulator 3 LEM3 family protein, putative [Ichthyophthirius multifiliis]|eukprot:XP_004039114.1 ligand-effect modulator 3 LEM3 family protein, putative [Ichthyophthirius multifiliis]
MSELFKEDRNKFSYAFKQQIMKAWQPVPTINSSLLLFSTLSVIFLSLGIALIVLSNQIVEVSVRYDSQCGRVFYGNNYLEMINSPNNKCTVEFQVPSKLKAPVYVYYELDNFYQNHRKYVKSKNINQLQGEDVSVSQLSDCAPIIYYSDLRKYRAIQQTSNTDGFKDTDIANPCGLIAASYFNDTYVLKTNNGSQTKEISNQDIAWPSDKKENLINQKLNNGQMLKMVYINILL